VKFQIGDYVKVARIINDDFTEEEKRTMIGSEGKIIKVNEGNTYPYVVDIPEGGFEDSIYLEEELELV
jgi:hypothetical protein